jgi:hypothetical protein
MSGFSLSPINIRLSLIGAVTVAIALFSRLKLGDPWATIIGCTLALGTGIYAVRTLIRLVGMDQDRPRNAETWTVVPAAYALNSGLSLPMFVEWRERTSKRSAEAIFELKNDF